MEVVPDPWFWAVAIPAVALAGVSKGGFGGGGAGSAGTPTMAPLISSKTPREIVERLHREINAIVHSPETNGRIRKLGADPLTLSIAEFQSMIDRELVENAQLIKAAGIKAN